MQHSLLIISMIYALIKVLDGSAERFSTVGSLLTHGVYMQTVRDK